MALIETQYEQLAQEVRNYENRMYIAPPALLAMLGVSLEYAFRLPDDLPKLVLLIFLVILCHAFTALFAKHSIFQCSLRKAICDIEAREPTLIKVARSTWEESEMPLIPKSPYTNPLRLYFHLSADKAVMWMMMSTIFGTLAYFIKTLTDWIANNDPRWDKITIITSLLTLGIFLIYYAILPLKRYRI